MSAKFSAVLVIFLVTISLRTSFCIILQGYNERCELYDETSTCDHSVGIMCIDSGLKGYRCRCPNDAQFGTVYDPKRNKCVGKVWNSCVRSGIGNIIPPSSSPGGSFNPNETLCVENAECNTQMYHLPVCMCKKGFFELDEGLCFPSSKYGQSCDKENAQCDPKSSLSCNSDGKCGCKEESHQFYDHELEKCVTYVGGNCTLDDECVPTAVCVRESGGGGRPGHHLPPGRRMPIIGRGGGGVIIGGGGGMRKRDIIFGSGEALKNAEGGYYMPNFNNPPFPNRHFGGGGSNNGRQGKCACRSGYSQTKDGFCMPSYGAECLPRRPAEGNKKGNSTTTTDICNPDQFLECLGTTGSYDRKSGFRCQCRNPLNERWDRKAGKCVSRPGKRCRAAASVYPSCETGSECVRGLCQCQNGTSLTHTGQCRLDFNQHCIPGECNTFAGLICHGKTQTCLCIDSYLNYDPTKRACVAERGSPCGYVEFSQKDDYYRFQVDDAIKKRESSASDIFINCEAGSVCLPQGERTTTHDNTVGFTCVAK